MSNPFTYHICWLKHNLHYYGVRYAEGCASADLWTKYFTSSNRVHDLREFLGEPDIVEVRKTFDTQEEARDWECRVLKRLNVTKRDDWINKSAGRARDNRGRPLSEEHKKSISNTLKGNIPWMKGKQHTESAKKKNSEAHKGKNLGEKNHFYGKHHSDESRKKISEAVKKALRQKREKQNV